MAINRLTLVSQTLLLLAIVLLILSPAAQAARPVLTVTGISDQPVTFSYKTFAALPNYKVTTDTIWTDKSHTYSAVSVRTLLQHLGAPEDKTMMRMIALNDYSIEVEIATLTEHNAFIAFEMDGEKMRIRDKGPLWVLYPFSENPEINTPEYQSHSIWQLKAIELY